MNPPDPKRFPLGKEVCLLAEDPSGLVAFFKPAGLLSHPNTPKEAGRALLKAPYNMAEECYELPAKEGGEAAKVWLLNRLDSGTSGVLLCGLHRPVAEIVREQFAEGRVVKTYFALVFGTVTSKKQVWRDRLQVSREAGHLRTAAGAGAEAKTHMRAVRFYPGRYPITLLELRPKTGRTHQLRVQCAKRKLPIVGDQTYGNFAWNREFSRATKRKRLFLHSAEIQVSFTLQGRAVTFLARAPLPNEFTP